MEKNYDDAKNRSAEYYDKNSNYVFNLSMIHGGEVHPVMIASTLQNAKDYVARVMEMYNRNQIDEEFIAHYNEEMWIEASDTMQIFVLAKGSEYRILRMKIDDYSYLDKQEELNKNDSAKSPSDNIPV